MVIVGNCELLAHAKVGEDVVEGLLGGDLALACDVGEVGKDKAEVFGDEVGGEMGLEAVEDSEEVLAGLGEGLIVAGRGDDDVGIGKCGEVGRLVDELFEGVYACASFGGNRDERGGSNGVAALGTGGEKRVWKMKRRVEVGLGLDEQEGFAFCSLFDVLEFCLGGLFVDEPEDDTGFLNGLVGALDANLFHLVFCLADAGRVDEAERDALKVDGVFYGIASGAVDVGDNGPVFVEKTIEEGRFAHVGFADDGNGDALFKGLACFETMG